MMLHLLLAQASLAPPAPTVTSSVVNTFAVAAAPPLSPTPTPVHVVVDQQQFWNSGLGIFLLFVIAIGIGIDIGRVARKGGTNGLVGKLFNMFKDFTNVIAYRDMS